MLSCPGSYSSELETRCQNNTSGVKTNILSLQLASARMIRPQMPSSQYPPMLNPKHLPAGRAGFFWIGPSGSHEDERGRQDDTHLECRPANG